MFKHNHPKSSPIFDYFTPDSHFIGVLSIPHSGEWIPEEFLPFLTKDQKACMQDVDFRVNELVDIDKLVENGIGVIVSKVSRAAVDLNRSEDLCVLNWKKNSQGVKLVMKEPSNDQVNAFISKYHKPYFEVLSSMIKELHKTHKTASFIDLHSMPSKATQYHLDINPNQDPTRPNFCLSDIEGKSCEADFINFVQAQLSEYTDLVTQNNPYFGGHITRYINESIDSLNNIQIEINRGLYMNEVEITLDDEKVSGLKEALTSMLIKTFSNFSTKYLIH